MSRFILGVTGASGAIYATRTAMHLKRLGHHVSALVTEPAKEVLAYEGQEVFYDFVDDRPDVNDFFAECASGSADYAGMAVVPCSMGTLGRIAGGTSDNLLVRSADVCLKERRPLVVPAAPHFYDKPATIEELADTVVAKVLAHLKALPEGAEIVRPWDGSRC